MATKFTFPAGRYYIGDPCYIIQDRKEWLEICDQLSGVDGKLFHWGDKLCWAHSTQYGDGVYRGGGYEFAVDSGLIGVVPVDDGFDIAKYFPYTLIAAVDKIFKRQFHVWQENGVFHISGIIIHT